MEKNFQIKQLSDDQFSLIVENISYVMNIKLVEKRKRGMWITFFHGEEKCPHCSGIIEKDSICYHLFNDELFRELLEQLRRFIDEEDVEHELQLMNNLKNKSSE